MALVALALLRLFQLSLGFALAVLPHGIAVEGTHA
jgi:hypothetical protein